MSVPKWRRSGSKLDAFYEAVKLRHIVTQMIMRSYGMKTKHKSLIPDRLRDEYPALAKLFEKIDKYQTKVEETKVLSKYDDWIVSRTRNNLFKYTSNLVAHISAANEIKCTLDFEFKKRISLEDEAISDIANIRQEVQFVEGMYADLGIEMNVNKTKICRIDKGFKFLKAKIHLTETGKIIMRPDHASIVRERRKLKKLKEKLDAGEIQYNEILQQYKSWRGYMEQFNSYKTLKNMDELFDDLFIRQWRCQENVERKQRNDYEYRVKFGEKQSPARRRHGFELESEWD